MTATTSDEVSVPWSDLAPDQRAEIRAQLDRDGSQIRWPDRLSWLRVGGHWYTARNVTPAQPERAAEPSVRAGDAVVHRRTLEEGVVSGPGAGLALWRVRFPSGVRDVAATLLDRRD